jgi:hypothetical protein
MQPSKDVVVRPQPIRLTVQVPQAQIAMRTHLWISWARIALQHETMTTAAREELEQAAPENRNGYMLQNEADAALVAICAAAFALEALSRELDELVTIPPATLEAWQRKPPPADKGSWSC